MSLEETVEVGDPKMSVWSRAKNGLGLAFRYPWILRALRDRVSQLEGTIGELPGRLAFVTARIDNLEGATGIRAVDIPETYAVKLPAAEGAPSTPADAADPYLAFENRFRTQAQVAAQAELYAPIIERLIDRDRRGATVVDIGCGRGELLDALSARGFITVGVEMNPEELSALKARGHKVFEGDANTYLVSIDDSSVDAITSLHVIEHMTPDYFLRFVDLLGRKVAPSGVVILETPNPRCREVGHTFYYDLTHVRPYPSETAAFYLERAGFSRLEVVYSSPCTPFARGLSPEWNYLNYALIAQR